MAKLKFFKSDELKFKQGYIEPFKGYTPITEDDKISLKKSNRRVKFFSIITAILFILTLPFLCVLPYEYFSGNILWSTDFATKLVILIILFICDPLLFLLIIGCIKLVKKNNKILNSKKIYSIKDVVEEVAYYQYHISIFLFGGTHFNTSYYGYFFERGMYIEIRYNPYSIKLIDDNLYDINFIYECIYLNALKEAEVRLLELQEELNNTDLSKKKIIKNLKKKIDDVKSDIERTKEKLSELPKYDYEIASKKEKILSGVLIFGSALFLIGFILMMLSRTIVAIISVKVAFYLIMTGFVIIIIISLCFWLISLLRNR